MKKIIIGCFLLSAAAFASSEKYLEVKVGTDLYSKYQAFTPGGEVLSKNTKMDAFNVSIEGMIQKTENLDLGLGIAYEKHSTRKNSIEYNGGEYDSIPVYFIAKYKFNLDKNYTPYVKFNLGYAYNKADGDIKQIRDGRVASQTNMQNGSYFALGGGVEYDNFIAELMYGVTHASLIDDFGGKASANYNNLKLSVGYKFNI